MKRPLLFVLLLGSIHAGASAASFDCKLARERAETMVCADAGLSRLDERLAAAYAQLRKARSDEGAERTLQLAWLKGRNACADLLCLQHAYAARISELQARTASASPLTGVWKKEFSCDGLSGIYEERCRQGQRDKFQLSIVVDGERVCGLHVVWARMGSRIDEVEGEEPSMTGVARGNAATVRFRSTWDGSGTASLRADGDTLVWKVSTKGAGESWIPDEAVLQRIPAGPTDRMPACPR